MPEFISKSESNSDKLITLTKRIIEGESGTRLYKENKDLIYEVTPGEVVTAFHKLIEENIDINLMKSGVSKVLNFLYRSLTDRSSDDLGKKCRLMDLFIRNYHVTDSILRTMKTQIKDLNVNPSEKGVKVLLLKNIISLKKIAKIYSIKENIVFPLIESHFKYSGCIRIMWSVHDDIRRDLKEIEILLKEDDINLNALNRNIGNIFFDIHSIKFRDEKILFPVLLETVPVRQLDDLIDECLQIGFPFINPEMEIHNYKTKNLKNNFVDLITGNVTAEQLIMIFNTLPLDITFVDANDEVKYFSTPDDRIFTRSKSIIGRKVQNCHPPESMEIVEKILDSFKTGKRNKADFRIMVGGKFIVITYFALRDGDGNYKGVLEISQDITEIKKLNGEKRLLEWS